MDVERGAKWCVQRHKDTNHFYDTYLPYEFHLKMVVNVFHDFKHLLEPNMFIIWENRDITMETIELAYWGHDLIEDTRTSYNDCIENLGIFHRNSDVADIIFAVTNETGRTRAERANSTYYGKIMATKGATFVKLCDRIANVQYSKMTKSSMFKKYEKENGHFLNSFNADKYPPMVEYLNNLFI